MKIICFLFKSYFGRFESQGKILFGVFSKILVLIADELVTHRKFQNKFNLIVNFFRLVQLNNKLNYLVYLKEKKLITMNN